MAYELQSPIIQCSLKAGRGSVGKLTLPFSNRPSRPKIDFYDQKGLKLDTGGQKLILVKKLKFTIRSFTFRLEMTKKSVQ